MNHSNYAVAKESLIKCSVIETNSARKVPFRGFRGLYPRRKNLGVGQSTINNQQSAINHPSQSYDRINLKIELIKIIFAV
jgi:hypothetical protein